MSALEVGGEEFGLDCHAASIIFNEVRIAVRSWKKYASAAKIPLAEQSGFRHVFE